MKSTDGGKISAGMANGARNGLKAKGVVRKGLTAKGTTGCGGWPTTTGGQYGRTEPNEYAG